MLNVSRSAIINSDEEDSAESTTDEESLETNLELADDRSVKGGIGNKFNYIFSEKFKKAQIFGITAFLWPSCTYRSKSVTVKIKIYSLL